jgi:transcriptional regulator with XRE-family HTH domain
MVRPYAANISEQEKVRQAAVLMANILREQARISGSQNPLKQESLAKQVGISQSCISRWLNGTTKTLQRADAWENLLEALCDARSHLPQEGWNSERLVYRHNSTYWSLDFKGESTNKKVWKKNLSATCDHHCLECNGLTPSAGFFCMHCGKQVSPYWLRDDMDTFLLPGTEWNININDFTRKPIG